MSVRTLARRIFGTGWLTALSLGVVAVSPLTLPAVARAEAGAARGAAAESPAAEAGRSSDRAPVIRRSGSTAKLSAAEIRYRKLNQLLRRFAREADEKQRQVELTPKVEHELAAQIAARRADLDAVSLRPIARVAPPPASAPTSTAAVSPPPSSMRPLSASMPSRARRVARIDPGVETDADPLLGR